MKTFYKLLVLSLTLSSVHLGMQAGFGYKFLHKLASLSIYSGLFSSAKVIYGTFKDKKQLASLPNSS